MRDLVAINALTAGLFYNPSHMGDLFHSPDMAKRFDPQIFIFRSY